MSINKTGCVVFYGSEIYAELIVPDISFSRDVRSHYTVSRIDAIIEMFKLISPIQYCVVENFSYASKGNVLADLGVGRGLLLSELIYYNINLCWFSPKSVKKFATGNGNAEKEDLINILPKDVNKYFNKVLSGISKSDIYLNDLCDAYWLGKLAISKGFNHNI